MIIEDLGKAVLGIAAVSLWGLAPACGPSIGSYCNKVCDCVGCSDSEQDECVDTLEDVRKEAEDAGCGSEFNDLLSCTNSELECDDGESKADGCESEAESLSKCGDGSIGGVGNPCQILYNKIIAKYDDCGIDIQGGEEPSGECSGEAADQSRCYSPCVDALTCSCLQGASSEACTPYLECIQSCG